ncbi:DUF4230 domain-containing protein [Pseudoneobacillus sp. C159]
MNKQNQKALEEVLAGSNETVAAAAMTMGSRGRSHLTWFPLLGRFFKLKITLIVFTSLLILVAGTFLYIKVFTGNSSLSETMNIVENVQELATLTTAEAMVTTIIKEEDNKLFNHEISFDLPGTKRTLLLIVPATVLAGVDLQQVTENDIKVDEENKLIKMTLPHATMIGGPAIQMDKVQTYSEEGLFRSEVKWDEGFDLAAKANSAIENEATQMGLLEKAEESATKILTNFFNQLGYQIQIQFN